MHHDRPVAESQCMLHAVRDRQCREAVRPHRVPSTRPAGSRGACLTTWSSPGGRQAPPGVASANDHAGFQTTSHR
jgi:hypothetical protein